MPFYPVVYFTFIAVNFTKLHTHLYAPYSKVPLYIYLFAKVSPPRLLSKRDFVCLFVCLFVFNLVKLCRLCESGDMFISSSHLNSNIGGFPGSPVVKNPPSNAGDVGLIPG